MAIAFCELSGHDNGSFYVEGTDAPACPSCGLVTDLEWINPQFHLKKRSLDLSYTYDMALPIASERFKLFASEFSGARFLPLPGIDGFYLMVVDPVVRMDRTPIEMNGWCDECDRYRFVAAGGRFPLPGENVPAGFSRTDVECGSAAREYQRRKRSQHPIYLVDPELGRLLDAEGFRGLLIDPVDR